MLIAGKEIEGIGLGTAQFAFRDRTAEDSVATVQRHRHVAGGVRHREPPEWLRLAGGRADGSR